MEVTKELLVKFLTWAIDEESRICGDYNGYASVTYNNDSYEKIADDFIKGAKNTEQLKGR
jgi:hypothetical protein